NNYFKAPWMPDRTEANPNELNQDDARYRSEERFSRNAETDLVCRLLLEKKIPDNVTGLSNAAPTDFINVNLDYDHAPDFNSTARNMRITRPSASFRNSRSP